MERITKRDLNNLVDRINQVAGTPTFPVLGTAWQVGNYCLEWAYGGVKLAQITGLSGSTRDISQSGFTTKKQLHAELRSFLSGLSTGKAA